MNIFVAGASGALGMPIVIELLRLGHRVTAMTRSESGSERLAALGAAVERIDAFDSTAVLSGERSSAQANRRSECRSRRQQQTS
jgi:uncharacterized protein YbjT (DUF2867 family)